MKKILVLVLSCIIFTTCNTKRENTCFLTGKVIDRDSKTLILLKQTEDGRYCGVNIPIDSTGHFSYQLNYHFVEAYELIFKDEHDRGAWRPILFFPDNDTIKFRLYSSEKADSNVIENSHLSLEKNKFEKQIRTTFEKQYKYWSHKKDSLRKINETDSEYAKQVSKKVNSLNNEISYWQLRWVGKDRNLFCYNMFLQILEREKYKKNFPIDTLKKYSSLLQREFPNHPYNEISHNLINGFENIKVGGSFVDFTAPDSNGKNINLSDFISQNELTLIHLWSPWCGPCIRAGKEAQPIYEEFKNTGFNIIGVVGGISSKEQFNRAVEKHKFPWTLLSEISNENRIWEKYNISNAGGGDFLVDKEGKILAIHPTPEELKEFISRKLNNVQPAAIKN